MGKLKDLENALAAALDTRLAGHGFKRRGYGFYKKFPNVQWAVNLGFILHADDLDLVINVAVRFDDLHDLIYKDDPSLTPRLRSAMFTLGAELGNITEWIPHRWTVVQLSDVEPVADSITRLFLEVGLPYLEKYSKIENALEGLSRDDRNSHLLMAFDHTRAERALGLAYLLGDKNGSANLRTLRRRY